MNFFKREQGRGKWELETAVDDDQPISSQDVEVGVPKRFFAPSDRSAHGLDAPPRLQHSVLESAVAERQAVEGLIGRLGHHFRDQSVEQSADATQNPIGHADFATSQSSEPALAAQAQLLVEAMTICFAPSAFEGPAASRYPEPLTPFFAADPC